MMWAMWEKEIPVDRQQSLEFFITLAITNEVTLSIIKRALATVNRELTSRGYKWFMNSAAGQALLGLCNNINEKTVANAVQRYAQRCGVRALPCAT